LPAVASSDEMTRTIKLAPVALIGLVVIPPPSGDPRAVWAINAIVGVISEADRFSVVADVESFTDGRSISVMVRDSVVALVESFTFMVRVEDATLIVTDSVVAEVASLTDGASVAGNRPAQLAE
jgi:hypothetical protein